MSDIPHSNQVAPRWSMHSVMSFDSRNSNRDSHAMEDIDAITYPEVNFVSASIAQYGDGLQVLGNLESMESQRMSKYNIVG